MNRHPSPPDRRPRPFAVAKAVTPVIEGLEGRTLLSVTAETPVVAPSTATLRNHTLLVQGSARGDNIEIVRRTGEDGEGFEVTINKVRAGVFAIDDVSVIRGYGLGGSDRFVVSEAGGAIVTPTYLFGGGGNDTLVGSSAADTIVGGKGNDVLEGRGAADFIDGSAGADRILGGDGKDRLTGGPGDDTINTGAGRDVLLDPQPGDAVDDAAARLLKSPLLTAAPQTQPAVFNSTVVGLTPEQIRRAYQFGDLSNPAFKNRGQGQTIAIVVAFHYPTALNDVNVFSDTFGLKRMDDKSLRYVFATGDRPPVNAKWSAEAALDIQWAHAIAPSANIVLVEARTAAPDDLTRAAAKAVDVLHLVGGGVVNMSFARDESRAERVNTDVFRNHKTGDISFVAAAGDTPGQLSSPGVDAEVLSVGGTVLDVDAAGNRIDETGSAQAGGGISSVFDRPDYQSNLVVNGANIGRMRVVPDVAYEAGDSTVGGVAVYNTTPDRNGDTGWTSSSGTSVGAPQWAGLVALANQKRVANGLPMIGNGQLNNYIYGIARKFNTQTFNDITADNNPALDATDGFDVATGWGTPKATALIKRLAVADSQNHVSSRVSLKFKWTADFFKDNVNASAQNNVVNVRGTGRAQIGPASANLLFTQDQDFDTESGATFPPLNQIDVTASSLRRRGTQITGTGFVTVVTFDGYSTFGSVRIKGQIFRKDGVDHIKGRFYAVDANGVMLKAPNGTSASISGRFVSRQDNF